MRWTIATPSSVASKGRIRGAAVHVDEERYVVCLIFRKAAALAGLPELESLLSLGLPYIAAYMVMADRILSVLHGAQEWPSELDDE